MTLVGAARASATRVGVPSRRLNRRTRRRLVMKLVLSPVMLAVAAGVSLPFYYIVVNTFKTTEQGATSPLGLAVSIYTAELQERLQFRSQSCRASVIARTSPCWESWRRCCSGPWRPSR